MPTFALPTALDISTSTIDSVVVFRIRGSIDETNIDKAIDALDKAIPSEAAGQKIIIDMTSLTYLNSKFIGCLASIFSGLEDSGGDLIIVIDPTQESYYTLSIVGIVKIISNVPSFSDAVDLWRMTMPPEPPVYANILSLGSMV
jgi:anti-anti-sigma factor